MTDEEWRAGLQALADSCAGVFAVEWVRYSDLPYLNLRAMVDPLARQHMTVIKGLIRSICDDDQRVDCLGCGTRLDAKVRIGAMLSLVPMADTPLNGIGGAFCDECAKRYITTDLWQSLVEERFSALFNGGARIVDGFIRPAKHDA